MGKLTRCALLLWIIVAPQLLAGTVYYVATNGNDSYNGLYPSYMGGANGPWRTLAKADHSLKAGDTLKIRGGTYAEAPDFSNDGTPDNRITITSYDGETVIIDGGYASAGQRCLLFPCHSVREIMYAQQCDHQTFSRQSSGADGDYGRRRSVSRGRGEPRDRDVCHGELQNLFYVCYNDGQR